MSSFRLVLDATALEPADRAALEAQVEALGFTAERWGVIDGPRREGTFTAEEWDRLEAGLRDWAERIELQVSSAHEH